MGRFEEWGLRADDLTGRIHPADVNAADDGRDLVRTSLERIAPPGAPVMRPWGLSVSAALQPHVPKPVWLAIKPLDHYASLRFSPQDVAIDAIRNVPWSRVSAVYAKPLLDVVTSSAIDAAAGQATDFLPLGTRRLGEWTADKIANKVADIMLVLFMMALNEHGPQALHAVVPQEIRYRTAAGREKSMTPGPFATAVLTLPRVGHSLVTTAQACCVPVYTLPPERDYAAPAYQGEAWRTRLLQQAAERRAALGTGQSPPAPIPQGPQPTYQGVPQGPPPQGIWRTVLDGALDVIGPAPNRNLHTDEDFLDRLWAHWAGAYAALGPPPASTTSRDTQAGPRLSGQAEVTADPVNGGEH